MTLKEKFGELYIEKGMSIECEKIADDFAIGFGEYLDSLTQEDMGKLSIKQLLEIYKKQKGL
jgi:hypothetical protein